MASLPGPCPRGVGSPGLGLSSVWWLQRSCCSITSLDRLVPRRRGWWSPWCRSGLLTGEARRRRESPRLRARGGLEGADTESRCSAMEGKFLAFGHRECTETDLKGWRDLEGPSCSFLRHPWPPLVQPLLSPLPGCTSG